MRSSREIAFRLKQDAANLLLLTFPPQPHLPAPERLALLPDPDWLIERLRGTPFATQVDSIAEEIIRHRFPLLGLTLETGREIDWRRDYLHNKSSGLEYFRRIPYLNFDIVGDHKIIWELNRHQHLVLLAQAFRFTGRETYRDELFRQIDSWIQANPFQRGINWTSALEVAFRALSWIWIYHLTSHFMTEKFRTAFLRTLYWHARHLEYNLSVYFSPNTHLLGEAVALHAIGVLFPDFPGAQRLAHIGGRIVREQLEFQVRSDGSHFEQSTYYQVYAVDFFLLHAVLAGMNVRYRQKLERMAEYLNALLGPSRSLPFLGDDDGGRLFHPYGPRAHFGRATLVTCARLLDRSDWAADESALSEQALWWLGPNIKETSGSGGWKSRLFPDAGIVTLVQGDIHSVVDAGPFGFGGAGHSHSDTLSLIVSDGAEELLIDSGTYTYVADPLWRNRFRGSAAHNTVRIDELDQAEPLTPFRWQGKPSVQVRHWETGPERDVLDAICSYRGFIHRRQIVFAREEHVFFVLDEITGPAGDHHIEQFWHAGSVVDQLSDTCFRIGSKAVLVLGTAAMMSAGWRSRALMQREPTQILCATTVQQLPVKLVAALDLSGSSTSVALAFQADKRSLTLHGTGRQVSISFRSDVAS